MKKTYNSPEMLTVSMRGTENLMGASQGIGVRDDAKVSNSADIGFVKENSSSRNSGVWDDDWSE